MGLVAPDDASRLANRIGLPVGHPRGPDGVHAFGLDLPEILARRLAGVVDIEQRVIGADLGGGDHSVDAAQRQSREGCFSSSALELIQVLLFLAVMPLIRGRVQSRRVRIALVEN